jgi:hypothetical protein
MMAVLVKTISFVDFDQNTVVLKENTEIFIDLNENVGFIDDLCFDVSADEFSVLN